MSLRPSISSFPSLSCSFPHCVSPCSHCGKCLIVIPVWQTTIFVGLSSALLSLTRSLINNVCAAVVPLHKWILVVSLTQWHHAQTVTLPSSLSQNCNQMLRCGSLSVKYCKSIQSFTWMGPTSGPELTLFSSASFSFTLWQRKPTSPHYQSAGQSVTEWLPPCWFMYATAVMHTAWIFLSGKKYSTVRKTANNSG